MVIAVNHLLISAILFSLGVYRWISVGHWCTQEMLRHNAASGAQVVVPKVNGAAKAAPTKRSQFRLSHYPEPEDAGGMSEHQKYVIHKPDRRKIPESHWRVANIVKAYICPVSVKVCEGQNVNVASLKICNNLQTHFNRFMVLVCRCVQPTPHALRSPSWALRRCQGAAKKCFLASGASCCSVEFFPPESRWNMSSVELQLQRKGVSWTMQSTIIGELSRHIKIKIKIQVRPNF